MYGLAPLREPVTRGREPQPALSGVSDETPWHGAHEKLQPFGPGRQQLRRQRQPLERHQHVVGEQRQATSTWEVRA